jgi:hypothetical protein
VACTLFSASCTASSVSSSLLTFTCCMCPESLYGHIGVTWTANPHTTWVVNDTQMYDVTNTSSWAELWRKQPTALGVGLFLLPSVFS